jgi:hypothetical protein
VTGIVLYTGKDTRIYQTNVKSSQFFGGRQYLKSPLTTYLTNITAFFLLLSFLTSLYAYLYFASHPDRNDYSLVLENFKYRMPKGLKFIQVLAICGSVVPTFVNMVKDVTLFIKAFSIQLRTNRLVQKIDDSKWKKAQASFNDKLASSGSMKIEETPSATNEFTPAPLKLVPESLLRYRGRRINTGYSRDRPARITNIQGIVSSNPVSGMLAFSEDHAVSTPVSGALVGKALLARNISHDDEVSSGKNTAQLPGPNPQAASQIFLGNTAITALSTNPKHNSVQELLTKPLDKNSLHFSDKSYIQIMNYPMLSVLGRLDHAIFDKTDTLTDHHLEIVYISTWKRSYCVETDSMSFVKEEFKKNPEAHRGEEDKEEREDYEDEFYSEKSQEFETELNRQYDEKLFGGDEDFRKEIEKLKMPYYMPVPLDYINQDKDKSSKANKLNLLLPESDDIDDQSSKESQRNFKTTIKIEELLLQSKGKLQLGQLDRIEALILHSKKSNLMLKEDAAKPADTSDRSIDDDLPQGIANRCMTFRNCHSFFYDNAYMNPEMRRLISTMSAFLFCGMVDYYLISRVS